MKPRSLTARRHKQFQVEARTHIAPFYDAGREPEACLDFLSEHLAPQYCRRCQLSKMEHIPVLAALIASLKTALQRDHDMTPSAILDPRQEEIDLLTERLEKLKS